MKVRTVEFAGSVAKVDGPLPGELPQVAFSGRSNVGKSSLINVLLRRTRKKLAHVSATPGKTQLLNFYRVNDDFFLVDLPGFGYAKVPRSVQRSWLSLIEGYLSTQERLKGVVHLVDCRRPPPDSDLQMLEYLAGLGLPTLIVLTKIDKLKPSQRARAIEAATRALQVDVDQILPFSSKTGEGREELLDALDSLLDEGEPPE
jgi:GTP-binding protein